VVGIAVLARLEEGEEVSGDVHNVQVTVSVALGALGIDSPARPRWGRGLPHRIPYNVTKSYPGSEKGEL